MKQVIVCRSPAEATFWELMTSSPNMFPITLGVVVCFAVLIIVDNVMWHNQAIRKFGGPYVSLIVGAIAGIAITWCLWI